MKKKVRVAVVGGGASGLAAAVTASGRFGRGSVAVIEKQAKTGRKLLATGNGRCNIGNRNLSRRNYHGDKKIIDSVLSGFDTDKAISFFSSLGLLIREDSEGRLYPYSNKASTVLDCLRYRLMQNGAEEICDFHINSIHKENDTFIISSDDNDIIFANNIIFASGSAASPSLGADTSGYSLLKKAGLKPAPLFPSLSPVPCSEKFKALKGVRARGTVSLFADNKKIAEKKGEIQFSDKGLSGICVFDLSRYVNEFFALGSVSGRECKKLSLSVDLMPETDRDEVFAYLKKCRRIFGGESSELILSFAFDKKLAGVIAARAGLKGRTCSSLNDQQLRMLADEIKELCFTPECLSGFETSQVSAGGYDSKTVDPETLMCRKIKNLYICGELLDADGDCGGYNLHFAFGSGIRAAEHIK